MYAKIHNKNGSLKHSLECTMTFGRKDPECPRCAEILSGSEPRSGWQKDYFSKKKLEEKNRNDIKNHDCVKSTCGPGILIKTIRR